MSAKNIFLFSKIICLLVFTNVPNLFAQEELSKRVRELRQEQPADFDGQTGLDMAQPARINLSLRRQADDDNTTSSAVSRTGPISGYMDFHFNNVEFQDPVLDFHRFVLLFTHSFSDRVRFVSEL